MEEEVGVKVTRLRRRLSIEAEDVKSPSTQSTPTKKRGGRLAAKPQLELIDENATETDKPKRTRKSIGRDAELEEKAVTPSRRSTRIRSNTSIVSETLADIEDKGTPSKRSTRIKSNTSIVAEAAQHVDSPRAKRAARRTSQIGSDNEAAVTPGRSTRRTRKDSTSSIDKQAESNPVILETQVKDVIFEEAESNILASKSQKSPTKDKNEATTIRKSPRLNEKSSSPNNNKENEIVNELKNKHSDTTNISTMASSKGIKNKEGPEEINLSISTSNLIHQLNDEPKKGYVNLNKTTSEIETQSKSKRHRTKSWTTITSSPANDNNFLSDTEAIMKKSKKNRNKSGSGDNELNTSMATDRNVEEQHDMNNKSLNCSSISDKKKKKGDKSKINAESPVEEVPITNKLAELHEATCKQDLLTEVASSQREDPNFTEKFFGKAPTGAVQTIVFIEDSDSNNGSGGKENVIKDIDSGDQCVPVVEHQLEDEISKEAENNLSYEPMDIDETIPENISLSVFTDDKASALQNTNGQIRNSLPNITQVNNINVDNASTSHRKSIISDLRDDEEIVSSKSKRKSLIAVTSDDTVDKSTSKSIRKSLGTVNADDKNIDANSSALENKIKASSNKSKRKSSMSITTDDDKTSSNPVLNDSNMNKSVNKFERNSANSANSIYECNNKSNRKSSISLVDGDNSNINKSKISRDIPDEVDNVHEHSENNDSSIKCSNKSQRTSITGDRQSSALNFVSDGIGDLVKKSKRKSILTEIDSDTTEDNISTMKKSFNKSNRMSNIVNEDDATDNINKSNINDESENAKNQSDKSTRKSSNTSIIVDVDKSFTKSHNADITNQRSDKSKRKSSISNTSNNDNILNSSQSKKEEVTDNCKRISSISNVDVEESIKSESKKNHNKSKRKSSISQIESQIFDKSNTENKSTLILSQINNISETRLPKDVNELDDSNEQLSKSINVPNIMKDKESNKKNLSLTYLTSTPLQQKSLKKLEMQVNSSIITPNSVTKMVNKKQFLNISKKEVSIVQNDEASEPSDEEDEETSDDDGEEGSEEGFMDSSTMIENEADEASDDYESGDSRDEDERKYEQEHEVIEKGETLDSEDEDFSDDSDYEKGSFIVDSDDEDSELLSGSGDDLSMSADDLSMSVKSKKKFNERKIKEQKKASREMFEARHKLNKSDGSAKSERLKSKTKVNRQRLESSDSESEEVGIIPRKNRRARIDSSQDTSTADTDKSTFNQKQRVSKKFTESSQEKISTNEKEISIRDNLEIEKEDPLSLQNMVKEEPKTPHKDFNVSTAVPIMNVEEVEQVNVESNVSIMKSNQTTDPLQVTMTQDEVMEDDSEESISENEEITQNYESILNDLNNKVNKIKSVDLSLNLSKKTKQIAKESIVDELNLTQVKKSKKTKKGSSQKTDSKKISISEDKSLINKIIEKNNKSINNQEEGSSDSIDMKLLFNEDSTDSENKVTTDKVNKSVVEEFIPLKKTQGKTNILENNDVPNGDSNESVLNGSKSKKHKQRSSAVVDNDESAVNFFIDTTGTYDDENKSLNNTSITRSTKKNKQKNNVSATNIEDANNDNDSNNDAPTEITYLSDKKKELSKQDFNVSQTNENNIATTDSKTQTSEKKNKKKKKSLENSQIGVEHAEKEATPAKMAADVSTGSAGKQKPKAVMEISNIEKEIIIKEVNIDIIEEETTSKKRKRKPSASHSMEESTTKGDVDQNASKTLITSNLKKKRKISQTINSDNTETKKPDALSQNKNHGEERISDEFKAKGKNVPEHKDVPNDEFSKKSKKRKERDDDGGEKLSKVVKQNYFDEVHVPRLPSNVLKQLDDKPKKYESKQQIISTTAFKVEEARQKRSKPSNYLEQSVYLNDSIEEHTKKLRVKTPKVLPFIPTASTSDCGFTTKFRVNVIPQVQQFVAQSKDISNFKNDYLQKNRIKKLGTFEKYKRHRNVKISKF